MSRRASSGDDESRSDTLDSPSLAVHSVVLCCQCLANETVQDPESLLIQEVVDIWTECNEL